MTVCLVCMYVYVVVEQLVQQQEVLIISQQQNGDIDCSLNTGSNIRAMHEP